MQQTMRVSHVKTYDEDGRIGQVIDSYRLVRRLGCGSNGTVYEAVHINLGRRYALKILHPHLCGNQQAVARFVAEGQTANRPAIAGVVAVHDVKRTKDGQTYILMEYLDGETLSGRIAKEFRRTDGHSLFPGGPNLRPVPHSSYVSVSLVLAKQIATTVDVIHRSGVVHRDLKPENLFVAKDPDAICGERIKILDFGIAKVVEPAGQTHNGPPTWAPTIQSTAVGTVLGTPAYMPPEQWYGSSQADARSDVYSCGVIFYEMMSGRPPFTAAFIGELMEQHFYLEPTPLAEVAPWTPASFASLVKEMLSKLPARRPTMAQVVERLQNIIREHKQQRPHEKPPVLEDFDETIRQPRVSQSLPEVVPQLTETPRPWIWVGIGVVVVALILFARLILSSAMGKAGHPVGPRVTSVQVDNGVPSRPSTETKKDEQQIISIPAGAKVILLDQPAVNLTDAALGHLPANCTTPCMLPENELRKSNIQLFLMKDGYRTRRLTGAEIGQGLLKQPIVLQQQIPIGKRKLAPGRKFVRR